MRKRPSATSASDPPKKNGEMVRTLLAESETLPLPQLREGGGKTPSQGDVIEAEIPDASGRPVGKVLLEALEVNPTEKSGIFARVVCTAGYGARGLRRSGSWNGEGPEGVHGSPLHTSGTWKVRRDRSCSSYWEVVSCPRRSRSRSRRGICGKKRNDRDRPRAGNCRSWASPFRTDRRRRAGGPSCDSGRRAGFGPALETDERNEFERAKEPSLRKQTWRSQPARRRWRTKWRREGGEESNGKVCATVARVPDSSGNESATCFSPKRYPSCGIKRKDERGASAFRTKAPRPEMDARSAGGEGTRIDGRRIGNGRTGQSAEERPGRESRRHGKEQPTKARPRGQENKEFVLKPRKGSIQQHRRGPGERRRIQSETNRTA